MKNRNNDRKLRFGLLPTALLLLAGIAGVASVGQADEVAPLEAATGTPVQAMDKAKLDAAMQADARDAAWLTRINQPEAKRPLLTKRALIPLPRMTSSYRFQIPSNRSIEQCSGSMTNSTSTCSSRLLEATESYLNQRGFL
jgi:hypothetical protein